MVVYNFSNIDDITNELVLEILRKDSKFSNLKEELEGKFVGESKDFDCYYLVNDVVVDVCNHSDSIVNCHIIGLYIMDNNFNIATAFARKAEALIKKLILRK